MSHLTRGLPLTGMTHFIDVFQATVDPKQVEHLLSVRTEAMAGLVERVPSFVRADLVRIDDRTWLDILVWNSETGVQEAMAAADEIPALVEMHNLMHEVTRHERGAVAHAVGA
jgi:hypothetical protein